MDGGQRERTLLASGKRSLPAAQKDLWGGTAVAGGASAAGTAARQAQRGGAARHLPWRCAPPAAPAAPAPSGCPAAAPPAQPAARPAPLSPPRCPSCWRRGAVQAGAAPQTPPATRRPRPARRPAAPAVVQGAAVQGAGGLPPAALASHGPHPARRPAVVPHSARKAHPPACLAADPQAPLQLPRAPPLRRAQDSALEPPPPLQQQLAWPQGLKEMRRPALALLAAHREHPPGAGGPLRVRLQQAGLAGLTTWARAAATAICLELAPPAAAAAAPKRGRGRWLQGLPACRAAGLPAGRRLQTRQRDPKVPMPAAARRRQLQSPLLPVPQRCLSAAAEKGGLSRGRGWHCGAAGGRRRPRCRAAPARAAGLGCCHRCAAAGQPLATACPACCGRRCRAARARGWRCAAAEGGWRCAVGDPPCHHPAAQTGRRSRAAHTCRPLGSAACRGRRSGCAPAAGPNRRAVRRRQTQSLRGGCRKTCLTIC
jgi:hypothetical protein